MPAGQAWWDGARPGMRIVSLDGRDASAADVRRPPREAELISPDGRNLVARVIRGDIASPWARISLWLTGSLFALLGAIVLLRRPDAPVARRFGLFTGATGIALGVGPAAGGPHPAWALVVQFLSLVALAASLPAFATAFVGEDRVRLRFHRIFGGAGVLLALGYLTSVVVRPPLYGPVRAGFTLYFAAGVLVAVGVLARRAAARDRSSGTRDARVALYGIASGTLPFVGFSLIPLGLGREEIVPARLTAVVWSLIPLTFAYAILRHQVLGIRRLVHRGMVYGLTTAGTLAVMFLLVEGIDARLGPISSASERAWATAALFALGVLVFHLLSRGARALVDRYIYPDEVDSGALLASMRDDLVGGAPAEDVVAAMVTKLRESLRLEAALLFLGTAEETLRLAGSAGPRADETLTFVRPRLPDSRFDESGLSERRWDSDMLLIARLETEGRALGFLVLGPKEKGEVFLREERRLVETVTPILALAIRETSLLAELREVSERLTDAEEVERGRIARDLHDGPLQKAILLGGGAAEGMIRDGAGVAKELVAELRELCARLRPAILDDLGLVPALEWLLEQTAQGFSVTPSLTLRGMTEDDRLTPGAELALFRVTQEAVSNALKHGRATSIHVSLTRTLSGVELSVSDDGSGAVMPGPVPRGLGIPGMRERLRQVGGSISILSDGHSGTMVSARIPDVVQRAQ